MNNIFPKRYVIKGVSKMNSEKADEDFYFIACMKEILKYLNEDPIYDYNYLCSVSGAGFTFLWDKSNWNPIEDITHFGNTWPDPIEQIFNAVGYEYEFIVNNKTDECKQHMLDEIKKSLYIKNMPVLAWGVLNTEPIWCIITGYDDGGDYLIGWHYRQFSQGLCNEYDYGGYFRKNFWFQNTGQILLIKDRCNKPDFMKVTEQAIIHGYQLITNTPFIMGYSNGLTAYDSWIEDMGRDNEFESAVINRLKIRAGCITRTCELVAEVYWNGMDFLKSISTWNELMAEEALLAAADFAAQTDIMYKIWYLMGSTQGEEIHIKQLMKIEVRNEIRNLLYTAKNRNIMAVKNMQYGLKKVKVMKRQYYLKA